MTGFDFHIVERDGVSVGCEVDRQPESNARMRRRAWIV